MPPRIYSRPERGSAWGFGDFDSEHHGWWKNGGRSSGTSGKRETQARTARSGCVGGETDFDDGRIKFTDDLLLLHGAQGQIQKNQRGLGPQIYSRKRRTECCLL